MVPCWKWSVLLTVTIRPFHFHTQIKRKYVDGHSTSTRNYYSNCAEKAFCTSKRTTTLSIANKNIPSRERGQLMRSCFRSEQSRGRAEYLKQPTYLIQAHQSSWDQSKTGNDQGRMVERRAAQQEMSKKEESETQPLMCLKPCLWIWTIFTKHSPDSKL